MIPGDQWVRMADDTRKQLQHLVYNDQVFTDDGPALVQGIIARPNEKHSIMSPTGVVVSICQPVYANGLWMLPIVNMPNARFVPADSELLQYDLFLDAGKSHIYVSATNTNVSVLKCAVLAHGIHEGLCEHPYFAYEQCRLHADVLLAASATKKLVFSARPWVDDADGLTIGISAEHLVV